ncbi:MAG: phosphoribosylglycinamide formyltransferase [Thermodesulfobacteriota bacterium]
MVLRIGWFSTGRDEAARDLLRIVFDHLSRRTFLGKIQFVFCNRERGESLESDRFIEWVEQLGIPLLLFSSSRFMPSLRERDIGKWREAYHQEVEKKIKPYGIDILVLAGYMLIISPTFCNSFRIVNLHPAAPGGPKGTWQEVIWTLIRERATESGVMIHLVTEYLDRGPPITFVTFPIVGGKFDPLWKDLESKVKDHSLDELIQEEGERNSLFQEIRIEGVKRELPLLVMTLKAIAEGRVRIGKGKVFDERGKERSGICLNQELEQYLQNRMAIG